MEILRTERLVLRTWSESDIQAAAQLWGDPKVTALISSKRLKHDSMLELQMLCQQTHGVQYWAMENIEGGDVVGCCGLRPWTLTEDKDCFELGFHIVPSHWRKGYAFEAASNVVEYAFGNLQLPRIFAGHHPSNEASAKVLEKIGFQQQGLVFYPPTGLKHPYYELRRLH